MEKLQIRMEEAERRIGILERQRETDYDKIIENNKTLSNILIELKNITKTMETLANNWKEAINRSNAMQKSEHEMINNKINKLEKTVDKLETKLESNTDNLEQEINDKTIGKDSVSWDKIKWLFIGGGVGLIFFFIENLLK